MDNVSLRFLDLNDQPITNGTKEKILEHAIELFSQFGYTAVSIRRISKEVGIKESSLYFHFENKEELLHIIFHNFKQRFFSIQPDTSTLDDILSHMEPEAFFERGFLSFKQMFAEPIVEKTWRIIYTEMVRDATAREILLENIMHGSRHFTETVFAKYVALGKIKPYSPRTLAVEYLYPLFTMLTEYNLIKFMGEDTAEIEEQILQHDQFFFAMIRQ